MSLPTTSDIKLVPCMLQISASFKTYQLNHFKHIVVEKFLCVKAFYSNKRKKEAQYLNSHTCHAIYDLALVSFFLCTFFVLFRVCEFDMYFTLAFRVRWDGLKREWMKNTERFGELKKRRRKTFDAHWKYQKRARFVSEFADGGIYWRNSLRAFHCVHTEPV